ncbi:NAD(P)H-hydrate dehydratase [Thermosulfurimonas marina]|uniref:Bifunctional NAD(P)H-hydrate repair enzyme n=1 Tax=Thermosulfurimonas marina TaxID=2047767 RepID=A0A6H1WTD3_9BACT|nr:NAD(P)H-hydrate dehydratase [Thermosulfurimonas marina]QJA06463.1 NAD(P)H-hydrate dehydratase [Thermosulfurimonas marina]
MRLVYAAEMQALDRFTIQEVGVPAEVLMENAGRGVAEILLSRFPEEARRGTLILCGPGNNGGDGLVVARHLHQRGLPVKVLLLAPEEKYRGEAGINLRVARYAGIPLLRAQDEATLEALAPEILGAPLLVDALFGTGLSREVSGVFARAIELMNQAPAPVVAVDMPSGLSADTGRPLGVAVRATLTATMALPKVGQVIYPGREYVGELRVVDIGMPPRVIEERAPARFYLTRKWAAGCLKGRPPESHKGTFGHLLVLAGSRGKSGAAVLCARGALRAGVGLVTLVSAASLQPLLASYLPEALTWGLSPETPEGELSPECAGEILSRAERMRAAVLGPGFGLSEAAGQLARRLARELPVPTVLDADALTALSGRLEELKEARAPRVLTPHPGEMARLLGLPKEEIQARRLEIAREAARKSHQVVVLKGAATVVAAPDGREAVNSAGNPGLAQGGTGDVLSGLLGALLAQGYEPFEAACLAVYLHGAAGDLLSRRVGPFGFTASEVADALPRLFRELVLYAGNI